MPLVQQGWTRSKWLGSDQLTEPPRTLSLPSLSSPSSHVMKLPPSPRCSGQLWPAPPPWSGANDSPDSPLPPHRQNRALLHARGHAHPCPSRVRVRVSPKIFPSSGARRGAPSRRILINILSIIYLNCGLSFYLTCSMWIIKPWNRKNISGMEIVHAFEKAYGKAHITKWTKREKHILPSYKLGLVEKMYDIDKKLKWKNLKKNILVNSFDFVYWFVVLCNTEVFSTKIYYNRQNITMKGQIESRLMSLDRFWGKFFVVLNFILKNYFSPRCNAQTFC